VLGRKASRRPRWDRKCEEKVGTSQGEPATSWKGGVWKKDSELGRLESKRVGGRREEKRKKKGIIDRKRVPVYRLDETGGWEILRSVWTFSRAGTAVLGNWLRCIAPSPSHL